MREQIEAAYCDEYPELKFFDDLDSAIIGVSLLSSGDPRVAYSASKLLEALVESGMGREEAQEFMEYNIEGMHIGDFTPSVVDDLF